MIFFSSPLKLLPNVLFQFEFIFCVTYKSFPGFTIQWASLLLYDSIQILQYISILSNNGKFGLRFQQQVAKDKTTNLNTEILIAADSLESCPSWKCHEKLRENFKHKVLCFTISVNTSSELKVVTEQLGHGETKQIETHSWVRSQNRSVWRKWIVLFLKKDSFFKKIL